MVKKAHFTGVNRFLPMNLLLFFLLQWSPLRAVEVKDGFFYVDGSKFFVKGIGYETHTRPGQVPWVYRFDPAMIQFDLDRIKSAHFNTLRTWSAISEEELKLVQQSGLKMLFGIWLDPAGSYGSSQYIQNSLNEVKHVLAYSKKYDCIIGYLIMNEPLPADINRGGAANLASLWQTVVAQINLDHPGAPVSFANTIVGDFIKTDFWGFAAYNAYLYNPVTLSSSHGYAGYLELLKHARSLTKPMVVTEFGLSVSPPPVAPGYGYGGNTLEQQTQGDLLMYRDILDAGLQGGCVFQYHDGWWKGGNEYTHEAVPEEWFGLIHFDNGAPREGTPRPAWEAFTTYNQAIITSPKNGHIYGSRVPVEIYFEPSVKKFKVKANGVEQMEQNLASSPITSTVPLAINGGLTDYELTFEFFDAAAKLVKSEVITLLCANEGLQLPSLDFSLTPKEPKAGVNVIMLLAAKEGTPFTIKNNRVDYVMHPHIGFDPGTARSMTISWDSHRSWQSPSNFAVPNDALVVTFGAGMTIQYGKFSKRIYDQEILPIGAWASALAAANPISGVVQTPPAGTFNLFPNFPNPFNDATTLAFDLAEPALVTMEIYNVRGERVTRLLHEHRPAGPGSAVWQAGGVASGIYFCRMQIGGKIRVVKMIFQRP